MLRCPARRPRAATGYPSAKLIASALSRSRRAADLNASDSVYALHKCTARAEPYAEPSISSTASFGPTGVICTPQIDSCGLIPAAEDDAHITVTVSRLRSMICGGYLGVTT